MSVIAFGRFLREQAVAFLIGQKNAVSRTGHAEKNIPPTRQSRSSTRGTKGKPRYPKRHRAGASGPLSAIEGIALLAAHVGDSTKHLAQTEMRGQRQIAPARQIGEGCLKLAERVAETPLPAGQALMRRAALLPIWLRECTDNAATGADHARCKSYQIMQKPGNAGFTFDAPGGDRAV